MPDLYSLSLTVDPTGITTGADRASASMLGLSSAVDRAGMATRLTGDQLSAASSRFDQLYGKAAQAASGVDYMTRSMGLAQIKALEMDATIGAMAAETNNLTAATTANAAAFDASNLGLGRIRQGLVSLTAQATGTIPVLDRIGSSLLTMGAGSTIGLGVVAGIAAIAEGYKLLTQASRDAAAEQDKLTKALKDWYQAQQDGAAGARQRQAGATQADLKQQQDQLASLTAQLNNPQNRSDSVLDSLLASIDKVKAKIQEDQLLIAAAQQDVVKTQSDAFIAQNGQEAARLATLIRNNQATAAERARALGLLQQDQALIVQYTKPPAGADAATLALLQTMRADLSDQIKTLTGAMNPKASIDKSALVNTPTDSATKATLDDLTKQLDLLQKVNEQDNLENLTIAQKTALLGVQGGVRLLMQAYDTAELDRLKAYHDLSGIALTDRLAQIDATEQQAVAGAQSQIVIDRQKDATTLYDTMLKDVNATGTANEKITREQITATADQIKANDALASSITNDLLQAFDSLARHGTLSFTSIAESIDQLTAKLVKIPGMAADTAKALQLVNVGLSGATLGYSLGSQAGDSTVGVLGGAAAGALEGNAVVPGLGAVVGGLAGAVGGLFGAAAAHERAAAALQAAADAFDKNAATFLNPTNGNSVVNQVQQIVKTFNDLETQLTALLDQAGKSGNTSAFDRTVANNPTYADLIAGEQRQLATAAANFFDTITQAINALAGPAGALANQLDSLNTTFLANLASLDAFRSTGAISAQQYNDELQKTVTLYNAATLAAKLSASEQAATTAATIQLSIESAGAFTFAAKQQLQRDQLAEQEREEMQKAVDQRAIDAALGVSTATDDATIAQLKYKDALEQTALAVQQFADAINNVDATVSTANDIYGITGTVAGITNEAAGYNQQNQTTGEGTGSGSGISFLPSFQIDLSPYNLSTVAGDESAITYLQGLYAGLDPKDPNYNTYTHEIQSLVDGIRQLESGNGGGSGSANLTASASPAGIVNTGTITGISDSEANGILGRVDTTNAYLASIDATLKHWSGGQPSAAGSSSGDGATIVLELKVEDGANASNVVAQIAASPTLQTQLDRVLGRLRGRAGSATGARRT